MDKKNSSPRTQKLTLGHSHIVQIWREKGKKGNQKQNNTNSTSFFLRWSTYTKRRRRRRRRKRVSLKKLSMSKQALPDPQNLSERQSFKHVLQICNFTCIRISATYMKKWVEEEMGCNIFIVLFICKLLFKILFFIQIKFVKYCILLVFFLKEENIYNCRTQNFS